MIGMTQSWETAEMAARETAVLTGRDVIVISNCTYVPHGIPEAALQGVLAATPSELVFVADKSPYDAVRHPLDPARQPRITASRVMPGSLDFGDGRVFVLPSKQARAIKSALQHEIEGH
jgi:hypothetical protein